jgi:hypothetical protein
MPSTKTLNIRSFMRNNTQRIYERLSRGEFLSVDSIDASTRHLYEDIEENLEDYTDYFREIGLQLEAGNGYFYFSRIGESKQSIEQKLDSFSKWLDYLDFLKCYNQSFTAGYQFRKSHLMEQISLDIEMKEKANHLFKKYGAGSLVEIVNKLLQEMQSMGFAECVNELDETYKVTSAFRYVEELVDIIQIANEDEVPE